MGIVYLLVAIGCIGALLVFAGQGSLIAGAFLGIIFFPLLFPDSKPSEKQESEQSPNSPPSSKPPKS